MPRFNQNLDIFALPCDGLLHYIFNYKLTQFLKNLIEHILALNDTRKVLNDENSLRLIVDYKGCN